MPQTITWTLLMKGRRGKGGGDRPFLVLSEYQQQESCSVSCADLTFTFISNWQKLALPYSLNAIHTAITRNWCCGERAVCRKIKMFLCTYQLYWDQSKEGKKMAVCMTVVASTCIYEGKTVNTRLSIQLMQYIILSTFKMLSWSKKLSVFSYSTDHKTQPPLIH